MTISATTQGIKPGVCLSTAKPANPFDGQVIYMTDVDQTAVWDGTQWTVLAPIAGGRNVLINGDFKVWQRGNARTKLNAGSYLTDRWGPILYQSGAYERVAGRATQYAMRVSSSSVAEDSNGTRMWLVQKVESLNSYRLRSQQVTLSFWVRFSSATCSSSTATAYGNWTADIGYYTSTTDSATGSTADDSGTALTLTNGSLPTTWTKYSVTGTCPSNINNLHARFGFGGLGNTTSNSGVWYEVAEVQLEAGAVATSFEFEDYGTTLVKCQRYFGKSGGLSAQANPRYSDGIAVGHQYYKATMRSAPTITITNVVGTNNPDTGDTDAFFHWSSGAHTNGSGQFTWKASAEL